MTILKPQGAIEVLIKAHLPTPLPTERGHPLTPALHYSSEIIGGLVMSCCCSIKRRLSCATPEQAGKVIVEHAVIELGSEETNEEAIAKIERQLRGQVADPAQLEIWCQRWNF
jgi:hypothetical protein